MIKTNACVLKSILILIITNIILVSAFDFDPDLEDSLLSSNKHFMIHYTDCVPTNHADKCVNFNNITSLDNQLEDLFTNYTNPAGDFQFNDPTHGKEFPIQVHPTDGGGFAECDSTGCGIRLAPAIFANNLSLEAIPLHEMFHQVEWTYGGWGFATEGMARVMQDKVYTDLDHSNGTEMCAYLPETNFFLDALTSKTLIDLSYPSCLFWTYLTEQYGAVTTEPQIGIDVIRTILQNQGSGSDDIQRVNVALNKLRPGATFKDAFMDFIVANYAKDLSGTNVPSKYQYIDDNQDPGPYNKVALTVSRDMPFGDSITATDEVRPWSAKYYEIRPNASVPLISINFYQPGLSSANIVYNILAMKNDDLVMNDCVFNVQSKNFSKSIINRNYDKVVVIVGGLDYPAAFRYVISTGGSGMKLNILWPLPSDPAQIDLTDLNKFQVHLELLGPSGVVSGLNFADFKVNVSGTNFTVVTGAEVMGQYWLLVQPESLPVGIHDLNASLATGSMSDTKLNAVNFRTVSSADNVLVIDRSGTMLQPPGVSGPPWRQPEPTAKIYGAIQAAKLYVNSFRTGDKVGLVWFSTDAVTSKPLMDLDDTSRQSLLSSLDVLDQDESGAWGLTSIGDGLWNAKDELDNRGVAGHDQTIILISDGKENEVKKVEEVICDKCKLDYSYNPDPNVSNVTINTIALGADADRNKLETIADESKGRFEYVIEPHSGDLPNNLADVYRIFAETILKEQRIAAIRGEFDKNNPIRTYTVNMENGATEATFIVNSNTAVVAQGRMPLVTLRDPDGNATLPKYLENTHIVFSVPQPKSGNWTVELRPSKYGEMQTYDYGYYLIEASVKSKATLDVFLGLPPNERLIGAKLPVLAILADTKPIIGSIIEAEIATPDVEAPTKLPSETYILHLYDDGNHGDGRANDGVYGGTFSVTDREGIYDMKVKADGYSPLVGGFNRETKIAFNMKADADCNSDGIPDKWANAHGLDPCSSNVSQVAGGDPDADGLINIEEFGKGTDPLNLDTDGGGEIDGSEVKAGRDPNNPADDLIRPPTSLRAIPGVCSVTLNIGYRPEQDRLVVYRSTNESGPWQSFEIMPTNNYVDQGLENDVTYYYKVTGVVQNTLRYESAPTRVVSATPKADPIPPSGYILINNGDSHASTENVDLSMWADPDTIEMKISNYPDFRNAIWEPFSKTRIWTLLPGKGLRTVYVLFKDKAGNIGPRSEYDPSVEIVPAKASIILDHGALRPSISVTNAVVPLDGHPCEEVILTIDVTNDGQILLDPVEVHDLLPLGLRYINSNPAADSVNNQEVIWHISPMATGKMRSFKIVAKIDGSKGGTLSNYVEAVGKIVPLGGMVRDNDTGKVVVLEPYCGCECCNK